MTVSYRVETVIDKDKMLVLSDLPFSAGDEVEVIVRNRLVAEHSKSKRYPLKGTPYNFPNPLESVAQDEWDADQ